jgi:predicted  nucleic acid-binding Zn-ribbon protein
METKPKALRRRLFGIRTEDVQQLLADRDTAALTAGEQVRAAEERAKAFEARAASLEAQLAKVTEAPTARQREASDSTDPHTLLLAVREEMARVMHATQEAGSRILDLARADVEHQLDDVERRRNEVDGERERLAERIAQLRDSAGGLRESIVDAAGFIHRTLSTMQDAEQAMARLVGRMAQTDAVLQKFQRPPEEQAPESVSASPAEHVPSAESVIAVNGGPYDAPNPPVAVAPAVDLTSSSPAHQTSTGSQETTDDAGVRPEVPLQSKGNGATSSDRSLAASWAAGPAGRRNPDEDN